MKSYDNIIYSIPCNETTLNPIYLYPVNYDYIHFFLLTLLPLYSFINSQKTTKVVETTNKSGTKSVKRHLNTLQYSLKSPSETLRALPKLPNPQKTCSKIHYFKFENFSTVTTLDYEIGNIGTHLILLIAKTSYCIYTIIYLLRQI